MWPNEPDEFVPNHEMQPEFDNGDAWYFPFIGNDLVCKREQGAPEPITADDFRWIDLEIEHKHFLRHFLESTLFRTRESAAKPPRVFQAVGLRGLLQEPRNRVLSCRTRLAGCGLVRKPSILWPLWQSHA